jgi:hypothetical protein
MEKQKRESVILPVSAKMVAKVWSVGNLFKSLYTEVRNTDDRYYHPLYDERRNSQVDMWYVKGRLRACDIRLTLWHHTVFPATRALDPTLNVGLRARAAGSTV